MERKTKKTLTHLISDSLMGHFCMDKHHHTAYYKIVNIDMGSTGHLYLEAEQYDHFGNFKKMIRLPPILSNFICLPEQELPWIKYQHKELPFDYNETN